MNKMLVFAIVLISITGVLCEKSSCYQAIHEECSDAFLFEKFAQTSDELEEFCKEISIYGKCILKVFEDCGEEEEKIKYLKNALKYIEETCVKENPVFEGLSSNLECVEMASRLGHTACRDFSMSGKRREIAFNYLLTLNERGYSYMEQSDCIDAIWAVSCTAMTVGDRCGRVARDAVQDILLNTDHHLQISCSDELIAEVPPFIEALQLAEEEEETVGNAIRRKK